MSCSVAERLEQRTLLTNLYVDDSFLITNDVGIVGTLDAGDTVTFAPGEAGETTGLIFGSDAFSTIQTAINAASATGDTILVASGEYQENPVVDKSVVIQGPNLGTAGGDVGRVAEAHVVTNGNADTIFSVTVNNVSIQGLSIDGDDPLVVGGPTTSGHDLNALHGVRASVGVSGLTVQYNIIANMAIGVRGQATSGAASTGNLVDSNWFNDIGVYDFGYAVNLRINFYADVTNNLMTGVHTGIQTNSFSGTTGPETWTFSGNEIHSYAIGIWHNQHFNQATSLKIDDNQLISEPDALPNNIGILLVSILDTVGVDITNTTITGGDYGIIVWNSATTNHITLDDTNLIADADVGVYLTNNLSFNPAGTTTFGTATGADNVVLDGISITGATLAAVKLESQSGFGPVTATVEGTTELSGSDDLNDVGILVTGPTATVNVLDSTVKIHGFGYGVDVSANALAMIDGGQIYNNGTGIRFQSTGHGSVAGTDFDDATDNDTDLRLDTGAGVVTIGAGNLFAADNAFIDNRSSQSYDLTSYTSANWGGLTNNFRIEDRLFHALDDSTSGLITWVAGNLFVTTPATGFSNETIQGAIDAATAGDTVNVEAGTYHEDLVLTKPVTLQGAGLDQSIISGPIGGGTATIYASYSSDGSIIDGFTVTRDGNTVVDWNADLNTAGLSIQSNNGIEVRNSKFTGNRTGIDINNANGNQIHNNIIDNNRTGIIFRNDCLDNLVTQNDITNNWTQGVVWLGGGVDGSGAGTAVTGNNISGNWYAQIENRDGTSGTVKNFSGNWLGTSTPTTNPTDEAAAPGYAAQIPVAFGGTAVAPDPATVPTLRGSGLDYLDFSPYLTSGVDTSAEVGFQGDFSHLIVTTEGGQANSVGRIQEAVDLLADGSATGTDRTIEVLGGIYSESSNLNKALTLNLNANVVVDSLDSIVGATIQLQAFTLTLGDNTGSSTLGGLVQGTGGSLVKQGTDTLILAGANAYTGTTTVTGGTLLVNGSITSVTTVSSGATLGGSGTIAGAVTVNSGGTLSPGNSPGVLSTNDLLLAAGSTFSAEVNGSTPGTDADEVVVTGTVNITGATLSTSGTITSFPGQVITLIDNDLADPVVGTFAGLPEGSIVTINGLALTLSYVSGDGNDVTLSETQAAFTIDDVTVNEGDGTLDFTVTLDKPLDIDVTVTVTFAGGTATGGGVDYTSTTQQVTFLAGETTHTVSVPINDDNIVEGTETFFASLSTTTDLDGRVVDFTDTGVGSITDNDLATVSIAAINDGAESNTPTNATFRVTLSAPSSTDTVVNYSVGGSATDGSDYTALTGTVTIPAGQLTADIVISVLDDTLVEDTETVILTLTGLGAHDPEITLDILPANLTATVNITDDDQLVITSSASADVAENTPANIVALDVNTNGTPGHTVVYTLSGPDAALFSIDPATGEIKFLASPDYENPADQGADNVYTVTVTATADFTPEKVATQDLTINVTPVNDNAPIYVDASPTFTIPENSAAGTVVGGVSATDADLPAETLTYSIVAGNESGAFMIDPVTGQITVADGSQLDFETTPQFTLTVRVTDSGSQTPQTADATVVVDLTNLTEGATLTIPNPEGTYHIGKVPGFISPDSTFTYGDVTNPNYDGAQVIVSIVAGRSKKDRLTVFPKGNGNNQINVKGNRIYFDGVLIGKAKGGKGNRNPDLVITLNANATTTAVDNLVRRLNIQAKDNAGTTRTVNVQVTNIDDVDSNVATREIAVVNS